MMCGRGRAEVLNFLHVVNVCVYSTFVFYVHKRIFCLLECNFFIFPSAKPNPISVIIFAHVLFLVVHSAITVKLNFGLNVCYECFVCRVRKCTYV